MHFVNYKLQIFLLSPYWFWFFFIRLANFDRPIKSVTVPEFVIENVDKNLNSFLIV